MTRRHPDPELLNEGKRDWLPALWQCASCEARGDKGQDLYYKSGEEEFCPSCARELFYICPACGELIPWDDVEKARITPSRKEG